MWQSWIWSYPYRPSACCESESELEIIQSRQDLDRKDQVQSTIVEKQVEKNTSVSLHCSQGLVCGRRLDMNAGCAAVSLSENDIIYTYDTSLRENTNILCTSSMNDDSESTNSMVHIGQDKIKESPKPNMSWENELADFPALSFLKDSKNRRRISRPREVVDARNDIPIVMMEQEIMEAINEHSTVIIRGETGCGKTTQVPQFLYEVGISSSGCPLGSGIIGVT